MKRLLCTSVTFLVKSLKVECVVSDLSTLANVVTTLATMGKNNKSETINQAATANGDSSNGEVAKAFDTLAKAVQPQGSASDSQVSHLV